MKKKWLLSVVPVAEILIGAYLNHRRYGMLGDHFKPSNNWFYIGILNMLIGLSICIVPNTFSEPFLYQYIVKDEQKLKDNIKANDRFIDGMTTGLIFVLSGLGFLVYSFVIDR